MTNRNGPRVGFIPVEFGFIAVVIYIAKFVLFAVLAMIAGPATFTTLCGLGGFA